MKPTKQLGIGMLIAVFAFHAIAAFPPQWNATQFQSIGGIFSHLNSGNLGTNRVVSGTLTVSGDVSANGLALVTITNSVFVTKLGNDSTGARARLDRSFLTLGAAKTNANSGDTIFVFPGTYNENDLLKNGVNWHFFNGAIVEYTGTNEGDNAGIFNDKSAQVISKVTGHGIFRDNMSSTNGAHYSQVIFLHHVSSDLYIEALSLRQGRTTIGSPAIRMTGGKLTARIVGDVDSFKYDGILIEADKATTFDLQCDRIIAGDNSGEISTLDTHGEIRIKARIIESTNGMGISSSSDIDNGTINAWLEADQILGTNNNLGISGNGSGLVFVQARFITNQVQVSTDNAALAVTIANTEISASGTNAPLFVRTTAPVIKNCNFIATSSAPFSILATSAETVTVLGRLNANKAKHANVTIATSAFTYP